MLIGRTDDPQSPRRVAAIKVAFPFGSGSRNPSGPAAACRITTGRTHDRFRTRSVFSSPSPLHQGGRPHTPYPYCSVRELADGQQLVGPSGGSPTTAAAEPAAQSRRL